MCRFVAYHGQPILIADLLYRPRHSLVRQSRKAEQMSQSFNADGFGVGFFTEGIAEPCIVRSTMPAWSNHGLEGLARRLRSARIFAHVRAASPGLPVQDTNCHPFDHGRFMFMHNGYIENFRRIKRRLQNSLSDAAWEGIDGSTDSEHAFALLIDRLGGPEALAPPPVLRQALVETLARIVELDAATGTPGALTCNFAVSDGCSTVVSRFSANNGPQASLYYSAGCEYLYDGEDCDMLPPEDGDCRAVLVASEPLTRRPEDWKELPPAHSPKAETAPKRQELKDQIRPFTAIGQDTDGDFRYSGALFYGDTLFHCVMATSPGGTVTMVDDKAVVGDLTDEHKPSLPALYPLSSHLAFGKPPKPVTAEAHGEGQEAHLLAPMIESTREQCHAAGIAEDVFDETKLAADAGYSSQASVQYTQENNVDAVIADRNHRSRDPAFADADRYKERSRQDKRRRAGTNPNRFTAKDFDYDDKHRTCRCPAGNNLYCNGNHIDVHGYLGVKFRGAKSVCGPCTLRHRCLTTPQTTETKQATLFIGQTEARKESPIEKMKRKFDTVQSRFTYNQRIAIVEPVFANLQNKGMKRFTLRGKPKVDAQWKLFNLVHNIEKIAHGGMS